MGFSHFYYILKLTIHTSDCCSRTHRPSAAVSEHFLNPVIASFSCKWNAQGAGNIAVDKSVLKCNISSFWESLPCLPFSINPTSKYWWLFTESLRPLLLPIPIFQPLGSCQTWCQIRWIYTTGLPLLLLCPICWYRPVGVNPTLFSVLGFLHSLQCYFIPIFMSLVRRCNLSISATTSGPGLLLLTVYILSWGSRAGQLCGPRKLAWSSGSSTSSSTGLVFEASGHYPHQVNNKKNAMCIQV